MLIFECGSTSDGTHMKHTVFLRLTLCLAYSPNNEPLHPLKRGYSNDGLCLYLGDRFSAGVAGFIIMRRGRDDVKFYAEGITGYILGLY